MSEEVLGDYTRPPDFWRYAVRCLEPGCALNKSIKTHYSESAQSVGEHHTVATGHKVRLADVYTFRNGKAILLPSTSLSRLYHQMARWGLRVHVLKNGARRSYVWCEKAVK